MPDQDKTLETVAEHCRMCPMLRMILQKQSALEGEGLRDWGWGGGGGGPVDEGGETWK